MLHGVVRRLLLALIERGGDRQSSSQEQLLALGLRGCVEIRVLDLGDHVLAEVGRRSGRAAASDGVRHVQNVGDLSVVTGLPLLIGDELLLVHLVQDPVHTVLRLIRVGDRIVRARCVGQARQERRLGDRQVLGGMREVVPRGGLDPVGRRAEGSDIEVPLEDLLLGVPLLQGQCVLDLTDLAGGRAGGRGRLRRRVVLLDGGLHQDVADVLLGQSRCSLGPAVGVGDDGADDAGRIDALVLVEALVLHGDDGVLHDGRDLVQGHDDAVLRVELGDLRAVGGLDGRDLARLENVEVVGQLIEELGGGVRHSCRSADHGHREPCGEHAAGARQKDEDHEHGDHLGRRE